MTLAKIIDTLKMIALKHPNVNSAYEGNIYDILNAKPDNRYASVVITQQSHTTDEIYDHYGFVIFYVDRLVDDLEENRVQIQSIGKSMLGNIITAFCNEFEAECDNISYQTFTQRFADETAGVYCTITIDTVKDVYCAERYWDENWSAPVVSIKNVDKSITITDNGHYVLDYDPTIYTGIGKVDIEVNVPDLNGSYEEGYNQGYAEGEQVSYNTGYEQGQADVAKDARVLEITENGTYTSRYSEIPAPEVVTGIFDDGTEFYDYVELGGAAYDTKIPATSASRIEMWYKGDNAVANDWDKHYNMIIGGGKTSTKTFFIRYYYDSNTDVEFTINAERKTYTWDENAWHHIIMSVEDGLWIDDIFIGNYGNYHSFDTDETFYINADKYEMNKNANGWFGMIKIDDVTIIPTKDGFLNKNTGELLDAVKGGEYNFTNNTLVAEGNLIKTVNVNVTPSVNIGTTGLKFGYSIFKTIPEWVVFDNIVDTTYMFNACSNLQTIPPIDTSKVINMTYMFNDCSNLQTIPPIDTSKVTNMSYMFYVFGGNKNLVSLPKFECGKVENMSRYFSYYADGMSSLTDVGGWENLKIDWNDNYGLRACPNLTYESCINILNGLYDFVGNGESTTRTLKVNPNFLTTVGDDITIGTNKGWIITA